MKLFGFALLAVCLFSENFALASSAAPKFEGFSCEYTSRNLGKTVYIGGYIEKLTVEPVEPYKTHAWPGQIMNTKSLNPKVLPSAFFLISSFKSNESGIKAVATSDNGAKLRFDIAASGAGEMIDAAGVSVPMDCELY